MSETGNACTSTITRVENGSKNNLYELLEIVPANPVSHPKKTNDTISDFKPNLTKYYVPKKGSNLKVKTVRDIRRLFEEDVFKDLTDELENQKKYLIKKITAGLSKNESTQRNARHILNGVKPISRAAWQMLININPENHNHPKQFVVWNGKRIQINGSRGGNNKFIAYQTSKSSKDSLNLRLKDRAHNKKNTFKAKKGLLRNSLNINFKPGPLRKKKYLDDSNQKHIGGIELIALPKPALDISPSYGTILDPYISRFTNNFRCDTGVISQKLAEFAVTVLGTIKDNKPVQVEDKCCMTIDLNYKCDQKRLLMLRDDDNVEKPTNYKIFNNVNANNNTNDTSVSNAVQNVVNDIIKSVEISLLQDHMYSIDDVPSETQGHEFMSTEINSNIKDRTKRKYCELGRLDVTIIKLPEDTRKNYTKPCGKPYCAMGCICNSLEFTYCLKEHCGIIDCMFGCKCDLPKYKDVGLLERECAEIIPGLFKLDNDINSRLAKEEQKFRQTVIVSGEKSIFLKSRKRNCKTTKKYADFYSNIKLKSDEKNKKVLRVVTNKLDCKNIEPWCMVHNLYRCFCKGKFIESSLMNTTENKTTTIEDVEETNINTKDDSSINLRPRQDKRFTEKNKNNLVSEYTTNHRPDDAEYKTCARTRGYVGRKHNDTYYINTNTKILEMELNDKILKNKMMKLIKGSETMSDNDTDSPSTNSLAETTIDYKIDNLTYIKAMMNLRKNRVSSDGINTLKKHTGNELINSNYPSEIVANRKLLESWLEASYKNYKLNTDKGIIKTTLEPPTQGKLLLVTGDFISERYRERKNTFFVSKEKPFKIYLGVDSTHRFFKNCTNIDEIGIMDMPKYPSSVQNLITSAPSLSDTFCILGGWDFSWELIGTVEKLTDGKKAQLDRSTNEPEDWFNFGKSDGLHEPDDFDEPIELDKPDRLHRPVDLDEPLQLDESDELNEPSGLDEMDELDEPVKFDNLDDLDEPIALDESFEVNEPGEFDEQDEFYEPFEIDQPIELDDPVELDKPDKVVKLDERVGHDELNGLNEPKKNIEDNNACGRSSEKSKWFLLTLEKDFKEILFSNRGFYVKYEHLIQSINIARLSGKTLRLSTQGCVNNKNRDPQFGIYATPNINDHCVIVGPYDEHEPLGIETVETNSNTRNRNRTRGVWITTNKVDGSDVLSNPIWFMPRKSVQNEVTLESRSSKTNNKITLVLEKVQKECTENGAESVALHEKDTPKILKTKTVKPIKIHRTNGFYHLSSNSILHKMANKKSLIITKPKGSINKTPLLLNKSIALIKCTDSNAANRSEASCSGSTVTYHKPVAEIAPQVKVINECTDSDNSVVNHGERTKLHNNTNRRHGMFVLKPEQINKKIEGRKCLEGTTIEDNCMSMNIEKFLNSATVCPAPRDDDVLVITDGEDETPEQSTGFKSKEVWIQCANLKTFGWIPGRLNDKNQLRFDLPGFQSSEYYEQDETFQMINQIIARLIYVPKAFTLKWKVVEVQEHLTGPMLLPGQLDTNYLISKLASTSLPEYELVHTHSRTASESSAEVLEPENQTFILIDDLEATSRELESQGVLLWNEAIANRDAIEGSLQLSEGVKSGMTEELQNIMSMNQQEYG